MTSGAGHLLSIQHQQRQVAVRAQATRDAMALWRLYVPGREDSWRRMVELATGAVRQRNGQSAALSSAYFERLAAVETRRLQRAEQPSELSDDYVAATFALTGLQGVRNARSAGQSLQAAMQNGMVRFSGSFSRLALEGGRSVLMASVQSSTARGYLRVTSANPCDFCAGLAAEPSASDAFEAHDHCACTAEPQFS